MSERTIDSVLHKYISDAHAMEMNVHQMLVAMVATTKDPETIALLERHKSQTESQIQRLEGRLRERGENTSTLRDVSAVAMAFFKGMGDVSRKEKAAKNARDGYVTEALEIASYHLLERLAQGARDSVTADIARTNEPRKRTCGTLWMRTGTESSIT